MSFRIDTKRLKGTLFLLRICCIIAVGFFTVRFGSWPFDSRHPRRAFITWGEDLTTNSVNIHVATADGAPGFKEVVLDLATTYGASSNETLVTKTVIDNWHSEWDPVRHPSSSIFLERGVYHCPTVVSVQPAHWKLDIPYHSTGRVPIAYDSWGSSWCKNGSRYHRPHTGNEDTHARDHTYRVNLDWCALSPLCRQRLCILTLCPPVIAFDAHVLSWNLDDHPLNEYTRHHVKEASYYGESAWRMNMVIRWPPPVPANQRASRPRPDPENPKLKVDFSGIVERGIWPAKKREYDSANEEEKTTGLCAMRLFEKMDARLRERSGDSMDVLFVETIIGSVDL